MFFHSRKTDLRKKEGGGVFSLIQRRMRDFAYSVISNKNPFCNKTLSFFFFLLMQKYLFSFSYISTTNVCDNFTFNKTCSFTKILFFVVVVDQNHTKQRRWNESSRNLLALAKMTRSDTYQNLILQCFVSVSMHDLYHMKHCFPGIWNVLLRDS